MILSTSLYYYFEDKDTDISVANYIPVCFFDRNCWK